jgi:type IV pilus biogenesis protein CpaD/CtpE
MRIVIVLALLAGCASKKASTTPANTAPAPAAEPRKESKESTDKDAAPADTKRKSDPCEGGQ